MELSGEPPCCKLRCCRVLCEENSICKSLGKIGLSYFDENRGRIMLTAAFLSFVALVLAVVPVVSTSLNTDDVKNTAWTYGEADGGFKMWIGLKKVVYESDFGNGDFQWESTQCTSIEESNRDFCDDCRASCLAAVSMVISNLITSIPNIKGNISRSTRNADRNCGKTMAVVTGIIGTASTLVALSLYADVCARNLPNEVVLFNDINYEMGPGFVCLMTATLLRPIDVFLNLLTPVPDQDSLTDDSSSQPATEYSGSGVDLRKSLIEG